MPHDITCDDFWIHGRPGLEHLRFLLDYAMWLFIEYDGKDDASPVSLVEEPKAALGVAIEVYIAEHKDEFAGDSDRYRREKASQALARQGMLISRRWIAAGRVAHRIARTYGASKQEVSRPLTEVLEHLQAMMLREVKKLLHELPNLDLYLDGRLTLLPRGDDVMEKYEDYLRVREKILSVHQRLGGLVKDNPEYKADYESPRGILDFPPPIERPPEKDADPGPLQSSEAMGKSLPPTPRTPLSEAQQLNKLPKPARMAFKAEAIALKGMDGASQKDQEVYDWLAVHLGTPGHELADYDLPGFNTWVRKLRTARKDLGLQKNTPCTGRDTGPSVITGNDHMPSRHTD